MTQNEMRQILTDYHIKHGISYKFIAQQIGISVSHLSRFISGERNLGETIYNTALQYINGGETQC